MGYFAVPLSLLQGLIIILVELFRDKRRARIDFMLGVNVIYFMCFCVVPLLLYYGNLQNIGDWSWILKNSFENTAFLIASLIGILGYLCIVTGCYTGDMLPEKSIRQSAIADKAEYRISISCRKLIFLGNLLFAISLACLIVYVKSIGGFWVSLKYASAFRGNSPPVVTSWSFLKNVIPLMKYASFFYFAAIKNAENAALKLYTKSMFAISFLATLYILFHKAGRRNLVFYIFVFMLAYMLQRNKISKKSIAIFASLSVFIVMFGDALFYMFLKDRVLYNSFSAFDAGTSDTLKLFILEFSFPFVTLANAVNALNRYVNMRFFVDIPLGVAYMLPQRLLNIKLPDSISDCNTQMFSASGTIPVDLISFGYYSMGIAGVMVVCYFFGCILSVLKKQFGSSNDFIMIVFKAEWIICMSFIVMYGDPDMVIKSNFSLFTSTLLLFLGAEKHIKTKEEIYFEKSD